MKLVKRLSIALVLLLILIVVGGLFFVDSLAKKAVERGGSYALGVPTTLDQASIGLFSGRFALERLSIVNPPGYAQPEFFSLRAAELELPLSSLAEDHITIPLLEIEGVSIDLERNEKGTNYGVILDHLKRFESGDAHESADDHAAAGKTFTLQRLVIRDVHAAVNLLPLGGDVTKLSLAIPEVVVEGLGTDMTLAEICALVVKAVIDATIQHGGGALPAELLQDLRGHMNELEGEARALVDQQVLGAQGKLEEAAKGFGSEAEKAVQGAGGKIGETLDGLLKKKKKD